MYVVLADKILKRISGEHREKMESWPMWDISLSPPIPNYPNRKWIGEKASEVAVPTSQPVSAGTDGPTLVEDPSDPAPAKDTNLSPKTVDPIPLKAYDGVTQARQPIEHQTWKGSKEAKSPIAWPLDIPSDIRVQISHHEPFENPKQPVVPPQGPEGIKALPQVTSDTDTSEEFADPMAEIAALHAEVSIVNQTPKGQISLPGGVLRHLGMLAGKSTPDQS